jgi:orotate phosphoribosyltransferase
MTDADRERLRRLLLERSVRFGDFTLASGRRSSYYIDCRPSTMSAEGLTLIGRLGVQAIRSRGWRPRAVGGLTMGADPVAYAIAAASWGSDLVLDGFSVRIEA